MHGSNRPCAEIDSKNPCCRCATKDEEDTNNASMNENMMYPSSLAYQFERNGYFALDKASTGTNDDLIFNRVVTLRDTWIDDPTKAANTQQQFQEWDKETLEVVIEFIDIFDKGYRTTILARDHNQICLQPTFPKSD